MSVLLCLLIARVQTEKLIAILTTLPSTSKARKKLTNKLIDSLWDTLQHPPLSYMGGDCKYTVAGSDSQTIAKPSTAVIEYKAPNGSCTIRESMPEPPSGVFKYRTPDGSYNVTALALECTLCYNAANKRSRTS